MRYEQILFLVNNKCVVRMKIIFLLYPKNSSQFDEECTNATIICQDFGCKNDKGTLQKMFQIPLIIYSLDINRQWIILITFRVDPKEESKSQHWIWQSKISKSGINLENLWLWITNLLLSFRQRRLNKNTVNPITCQ